MKRDYPRYLQNDFGSLGQQLFKEEIFEESVLHIIDMLASMYNEQDPLVLVALALSYRAPTQGNVGIDIKEIPQIINAEVSNHTEPAEFSWPDDLAVWQTKVLSSSLVGNIDSDSPFIVQDLNEIYLLMARRFWVHQKTICERVDALINSEPTFVLSREIVEAGVLRLMGDLKTQGSRAVLQAAYNRFTVVTGGPGTGKTYSIKQLLALLLEQVPTETRYRVILAAPTGKAAVRMKEALSEDLDELKTSNTIKELIANLDPQTVHRMLVIRPNGSTRYNASNPLPADLVIIDEASMVDIVNMRRILDAIQDGCRLILLGDRDQLASVDAGTVLSDIVSPVLDNTISGEPALLGSVVHFNKNHRFAKAPTVSAIASALQKQDSDINHTMSMLLGNVHGEGESILNRVQHIGEPRKGKVNKELFPLLVQPYFEDDGLLGTLENLIKQSGISSELHLPKVHLDLLNRFQNYRILGAHKKGDTGVETVEKWMVNYCRERLTKALYLHQDSHTTKYPLSGSLYLGQPIQIIRNDYHVGLMNGDIGLILPNERGVLVASFPTVNEGVHSIKQVPITQLPEHVSAHCTTVHKSQGSQFSRVALMLAGQDSPIQTRELVYTALTRCKDRFDWIGSPKEMKNALQRKVSRASGLSSLLWEPKP